MVDFDYSEFGHAFIDRQLHKLREMITSQYDDLFRARGILVSSTCISTILYLSERGGVSITSLAEGVGYSHQLTNQRLVQMTELGLADRQPDPRDKRRCLIELTPKGHEEADRIRAVLPEMSDVFGEIFSELSVDLSEVLTDVRVALSDEPFDRRVSRRNSRKPKKSRPQPELRERE